MEISINSDYWPTFLNPIFLKQQLGCFRKHAASMIGHHRSRRQGDAGEGEEDRSAGCGRGRQLWPSCGDC